MRRLAAELRALSTSPLSSSLRGRDGLRMSAPATSARSGGLGAFAPLDLERAHRGLRLLLPLGDDADEIADDDGRDNPGQASDGGFVDADQRSPDMVARIEARIGRTHDPAMEHSGHPHVVDIDEAACRLGRQVDARRRSADDAIGGRRLDRRIVRKL